VAGVTHAEDSELTLSTSYDNKTDATRIRGSIAIAAPPMAVWKVLNDCPRMPKIIPHLESCRVLEKDPAGHWDVTENVVNPPLLSRVRTIMRNTLEPGKRLAFKLVRGDLRVSEGEWRLEAAGKGTMLIHDAVVAPNFFAPQFVLEQAIKTDFPNVLRAIKVASEQDAAKR
jgi:uncharacterized membrane protein